ncbi:metallophosphoesterase [Allopusillimonas ginsengisoli]|uniref:metallophosphoesterase n=1 Tax=Allopusillimonas ginsengisoli TaxID=453575 RepID=UPI0010201A0A|nr:metallophosphoesterase [Allopusillimonas ginsengisoli]TEA78212.1 calcineurin-like phosphoesterase 5 [Allopusillimonas ginsengisoli]
MSRTQSGEQPLFTFVVVADTHINEGENASSSPFQTNALANARARHVFLDIAAMDPAPKFVIHLGDIVHPVPSLPTFTQAVAHFKAIASAVSVPVYVVPGNHDVGDKRVDWMPADQVCDAYLDTYRKAFGPDYFSFDEGRIRFVLINSLLINSGLAEEERQKQWLESQFETAGERQIFLFMHYPPYIFKPDERGNYDNLDEPGRSWLLGLMRKPNVEATFAGHVHNFWYDRVGAGEFYMLPSTAFLRHDFTEFYRTAPDVEFGRGDAEKFGYFVVDVYARGHVAHSVRTMGAQATEGATKASGAAHQLIHPKTSTLDNVGVELRHPWAESMQITATGGVQEFGRKWARNDYPLLGLWEMGARLSKVPALDLDEEESRARMRLMAQMGHRYIVTTLGVPSAKLLDRGLADCGVAAFEVNLIADQFEQHRSALKRVRKSGNTRIYYAKIHTNDPSHYDGKHFNHFVKAGFTLADLETDKLIITGALQAGEIDGITVRVTPDEYLPDVANRLRAFSEATGCKVLVSLKLSGSSLAASRTADDENVASVAQVIVLSRLSEDISYVYDTFMDVDRGYFPRNAFIDRHFNPRPMAKAYACLNALLSPAKRIELIDTEDGSKGIIKFRTEKNTYLLVCAQTDRMIAFLSSCPISCVVHNLGTGIRQTVQQLLAEFHAHPGDYVLQTVLITLE